MADETETPVDGVRFIFHNEPDGSSLELQMTPDEHYTGEIPTLKMTLRGDQFEGGWANQDFPPAWKLKLVRLPETRI